MRIFRRANRIAALNLLAGIQRARFRVSHSVNRTISRLYGHIKRAERYIALNQRQRDQSQTNDQRSRNPPTQDDRPQAVSGSLATLSARWSNNSDAGFARLFQGLPAGNAFVRVIDP